MNKYLDDHDSADPNRAAAPAAWKTRLAGLALVALVGGVYVAKLYPDIRRGDSAEIQLMTVLLGVCHPPGYGIQVMVGKLFTLLPFGPGPACRVNLLMAVCGVGGVLTLFGILRRMTGRIVPALAGALTLAFSITWWTYADVTEVYVFHALFLLLGIYAALRFLETDRGRWLGFAALTLGICIGSRLSELSLAPAFVLLWWGARRRVRFTWARLAAVGAIAAVPFLINVAYFLERENPTLLHARDDAYRDEILKKEPPATALTPAQRVREALMYSLGLRGAGQSIFTEFSWWRVGWDLNKYAWQLSGQAAAGDRFSPERCKRDPVIAFRQREQGSGTSITALGVALALLGFRHWRREKFALLFATLLFLGNLAYYLYMHPVDNLQFTLPGLIGLSLLIGWGLTPRERAPVKSPDRCAPSARRYSWTTVVLYTIGFLPPIFLFATNLAVLDYHTPEIQESLALAERVKATPLPDNAVVIANYPRAQRLRYLYWVAAGRTNVRVFVFREQYDQTEIRQLVEGLRERGHPILFSAEVIGKEDTKRVFAQWTPPSLVELGLYHPFRPAQR